MNKRFQLITVSLACLALASLVIAQSTDTTPTEEAQPQTKTAGTETDTATDEQAPPSATEVLEQLKQQRREMPVIQPTDRPIDQSAKSGPVEPAATVDVDESILGNAPGAEPPKLRREGEFLRNRRGRLLRAEQSGHVLFVFDADSQDTPERPMVLVPCQRLQEMEELAQLRTESIVFVVSGKVLVYRGVNYLLPTMVKLDTNRGNLNN